MIEKNPDRLDDILVSIKNDAQADRLEIFSARERNYGLAFKDKDGVIHDITTAEDEVDLEDLNLTGALTVDTVDESTAGAGVTIEGVLIKDDVVAVDTISEFTAAAGVTIDGTLIKDAGITATGTATFSNTTGVTTNTITERTAAAGVTVDGVLLKDSSIALADGTVGNLAVKVGADTNNGLYGVSDTQLGIAVEGALVAGADTNGLFTGNIAEQVSNAGVTVDSLLIKDGALTTVKSNVTQITSTSTGVVVNGGNGAITTFTQTLTTDTSVTFTVTNTKVIASSSIMLTLQNYTGVYGADGIPNVAVNNIVSGAFDITISNPAATALAGVLKIGFLVL